MRAIALVAAIALAPAPAVAADCMEMGVAPQLLTHGGDVLPADGGVLFGWQPSSQQVIDDQVDWRFRVGGKKLKPARTVIAPGLVRYGVGTKVKKTRKGPKVTLVDKAGAKLGAFVARTRAGSAKFKAGAPSLTRVTVTRTPGRRGDLEIATVELGAAPPADAYGLVLYEGGAAITWTVVLGSAKTTFDAYRSPGSCARVPDGMRAPTVGADVEVAWVDAFGRLSPRSAAVQTQ